jgi:hypothetical protein
MAQGHRRGKAPGIWSIVNRLAQCNVALGICIAGMIRLSMSFSDRQNERPDPFAVLGFFALMAVAIYLVLTLRKEVHRISTKWQRVVAALTSFAIQLGLLEILILFVAS